MVVGGPEEARRRIGLAPAVLQYVVKRLLLMIVTLFGITVITFAVTRLTPGEPVAVSQRPANSDQGGYDSLLEQNRRNLGLDRPMVFNFNFEDRDWKARQALADYCRPTLFWQKSAERNLRMASTIAFAPALERLDALAVAGSDIDHTLEPTTNANRVIDPDDCITRIVALLPSLAQERPESLDDLDRSGKIAFWKSWYETNSDRWHNDEVRATVETYINEGSELDGVLQKGGYAVPYLMQVIHKGRGGQQLRANNALSALTGFSYLGSSETWAEERATVLQRWKSFYNRDRARFLDYGPVGDFLNVFRNTQFGIWFGQIMRFDFGESFKYNRSVNELILDRLPITFMLSVLSIFFSYLISIPLGILSAIRRYRPDDKIITLLLFILYSLPTFWVGQMLLLTLTGGPSPWPGHEWPELFPTRGVNSEGLDWTTGHPEAIVDLLWHLVLPTFCITYGSLAFISRQMRSAMLETLNEDYIRTAYAKGLSGTAAILRHALRNSLIPIITISAGLLPDLIAGSIVVESIFNIPGMGMLAFEAILNRDYPVINAILFFSAALTLLGILLADLSYAIIDPRISYD